jgi:hypothetical protein
MSPKKKNHGRDLKEGESAKPQPLFVAIMNMVLMNWCAPVFRKSSSKAVAERHQI